MSLDDATLRGLAAELRVPGEGAARERAAQRVVAAYRPPPRRRRARLGRAWPVVALLVLGFAASALASTGPGGTVTRWVRSLVDSAPGGPLGRLPAGGRLLVTGAGGAWLVDADGDRHRLGDYTHAGWSPRGLFVAAAKGRTLAALDPSGEIRWRLTASATVRRPVWSPDGYRVAYADGRVLRVVAGDGSGDRALAAVRSSTAFAWRRDATHTLALVTGEGMLATLDADGGTARALADGLSAVRWVGWSGPRRVLVATSASLLAATTGGRLRRAAAPRGARIAAAAIAPGERSLALVLRRGATSEVVLVDARTLAQRRTLTRVRDAVSDVVWSPDGRWLAVSQPRRGRWLLLPVTPGGRPRAVTGLAAAFGSPAAAARPRGWCCAASPPG